MPSLLRSRIKCFYCGIRSSYSKGDNVRSFQCASCEGTNYLDQNGNITDVPSDVVEGQDQSWPRYATARIGSVSPPARTANENSIFCDRCLKNQRFLADCLANYLPPENDPRYIEYEEGLPAYKKSLEIRYPPVCAGCEPRVRARLKQTSYAAKTDILSKSLTRGPNSLSDLPHQSFLGTISKPALVTAEFLWICSLLAGLLWHMAAFRACGEGNDSAQEALQTNMSTTLRCLANLFHGRASDLVCKRVFHDIGRQALLIGLLLLWWSPAMIRYPGQRVVGTLSFYQISAASFVARFALWAIAASEHGLSIVQLRRLHVIGLLISVITLLLSYTVIRPAPRQRIQFRSLDSPLIQRSEDALTHAIDDDQSTPKAITTPRRFDISSLSHKGTPMTAHSARTYATSQFTPTPARFQSTAGDLDLSSNDAMDWEPIRPQAYNFRPKAREATATASPAPLFPSTSAFSGQPIIGGPSPFHGTLPAAPRSMEARLRTAAQQQPAQFKPTLDSKQADWFKRMRLSQASWASKDYVSTVADPDKRTLELREPSLHIHNLGMNVGRKDGGTGLEDIFGTNFKLDDDSPIKENGPDLPESQPARRWSLFAIASIPLWILCFVYLLQDDKYDALVGPLGHLVQSLKELGYGH